MHLDLLQWLRCPACRGGLSLSTYEKESSGEEVSAGLLSCSCQLNYPVWAGVPRMLLPGNRIIPNGFAARFQDELTKHAPELIAEMRQQREAKKYSFDVQWSMYEYGELTWELDLSTRVDNVYHYLGLSRGDLNGAVVLDAGCGNGTLTAALAASGPTVIGLDYSGTVERAQREKTRFAGRAAERVDYVQADLQEPPFSMGSFDVVYSDGVLHHTPSTQASFSAVGALVREGGRMFVWIYRSDLAPAYKVKMTAVKGLQALMRPMPPAIAQPLCYAGAAVLLAQVRIRHLFGDKRRRIVPLWLRAVNLFDTLTPRYYHLHKPVEVRSWFVAQGFTDPIETTIPSLGHGGFGLVGIRPRHSNYLSSNASWIVNQPHILGEEAQKP